MIKSSFEKGTINFKIMEGKNMLRPLGNKMLVLRKAAPETTETGLYIVEKAREVMQEGEVLATGPGANLPDGTIRPMLIKVGDTVMFGKYAGYPIEINDDDLLIMDEDDIEAVKGEG